MKYGLTLVLALMTWLTYSQTQATKDSLIYEMCKTMNENSNAADSSRVYIAYQKHLYPFLSKYPEGKRDGINESIYYRMQLICGAFKDILLRAEPPNEEWEKIIERPKSFPDKKTCRDFLKQRDYTYIESTGDTVRLSIKNGIWTDKFKDGTYSKLKFRWLTDCEFEIEFIESNNAIRKNLSTKGDKYKYYIIEKGTGYYYMAVDIQGTDKLLGFKLFH